MPTASLRDPTLAGGNDAITVDRVRAAAARFHGEIEQMPPQFSAKKVDGQPAYKMAREGKPVELKPAKIRIDSFEIAALEGPVASSLSISVPEVTCVRWRTNWDRTWDAARI